MAIRVGTHNLTTAAEFELSNTAEKLQSVDFLSFSTNSSTEIGVEIYSNTSDTSTYQSGKILFHSFGVKGTKILSKDDFPVGDLSASIFGDDATYKKLTIRRLLSNDDESELIIHYSVTDAAVSGDYSTEEIQDIVGAMFTGNTETNITATYEDSDGTIDLVSVDTGEANVNADWNSSSGDSEILNKPTVTAFPSTVASGNILWKQAKVTLSEAQLDALHTTPITLVAAQGADTIIMCGDALALVDRDASQAQDHSTCDLVIGYDSTTDFNKAILYERRFMYNEGGDRTWSLKADYSGEVAASLTGAVNVPVTAAFTNAITSNSLDSVTFYIQYYVIDNS